MIRYLSKIIIFSILLLLSSCKQHYSKLDEVLDKAENLLTEIVDSVKQDLREELDNYFDEKETALGTEEGAAEQAETLEEQRQARPNFKELTLVSWNIQHLGRSKTDAEIEAMAQILRYYDIVAIQEVVAKDPAGAQAVARLADALSRTGANWDYQISDPTKSPSSYISERYAYLWKPSKVAIQKRAFLDSEREENFYREPYIAAFKSIKSGKVFYVANFHARTHDKKPQEEIIHLLDYAERWDTPYMLLAGDFNTPETDAIWDAFYQKGYESALKAVKTTLKRDCVDGVYVNHPIDNIYYTSAVKKHQAKSIDFVNTCENLPYARGLSDHLPVFLEFSLE